MTAAAIITLIIIALALVLFITELISIDVVALSVMAALMLTGVISLEEGLSGFSNPATLTVAFMFILSAALLKTGALQFLTYRLTKVFAKNTSLGIFYMMVIVAIISAIVNNTPVVAVFIPVVLNIAHTSKISPSKLLIPLSFASIMGGMLTIFGTSTNLLVNGIALQEGIETVGVFDLTIIAVFFLAAGVLYMTFVGFKQLPERKPADGLITKFDTREYLTEIQIFSDSELENTRIMDSKLVRQMEMDILAITRGESVFSLPPGDFVLQAGDILKMRCSADKIRLLKDQAKVLPKSDIRIGNHNLREDKATLVEMVITSYANIDGQTLREVDFRRRFRAAPLAIRHREEVVHENLYDVKLKTGDVILAEVKTHFIPQLKQMEIEKDAPFAVLSEDNVLDFNKRGFFIVLGTMLAMIGVAASGIIPIALAALLAVLLLVLFKCISMKEAYEGVNWKIVFLLAGVLSLGVAMNNVGLDVYIASVVTNGLNGYGPVVVLSVIYLVTMLLTEVISNNAAAALMTPIGITIALSLNISPTPFLIAVMFAASASFMTPIGYQTNTMVYEAGHYRFSDFIKVGGWLSLLFWIMATILIPLFFPF